MIKFEGQLCEQVETRVVKKIRIFTLICSIFVSTIMCTLFIYIGYASGLLYPFAICALVAIAYVIFMIVYCCLPCSRKDNLPACPTKIVIDDDYIAIYLRIGAYKRRDLYDVKKVIDYGVFYDMGKRKRTTVSGIYDNRYGHWCHTFDWRGDLLEK